MDPTFLTEPSLPGRIGLCSARSLESMLGSLLPFTSASLVMLLLTDEETKNYPGLAQLYPFVRKYGVTVVDYPVPPLGVPASPLDVQGVCEQMLEVLRKGKNVLICDGGCAGRSGTLAACCLVAAGSSWEEALASVRRGRPEAIETKEQEAFVRFFAAAERR